MYLHHSVASILCTFVIYSQSIAFPVAQSTSPDSTRPIDPQLLPYINEQVLAANKLSSPPAPHTASFCFRPTIRYLTPSTCTPVIDAILSLHLANDDPHAPLDKRKSWTATTKSGPIYQWGIPGNPCKIKVIVDPSLGPAVEVQDSFSKQDVWKAAKLVVGDCVEGKSQAGRRALGMKKGIFVTVGRLGKDESV
ncbi:MAG: hypothetical protein Q9220_003346 [cf. Caloplaca sp. 1 TL-2023]